MGKTKKDAKLLVVDDEQRIVTLLSDLFRHKGYDVQTAFDGNSAWTLLEQHIPDMVISDINMPGMGGFTLLEKVEKHFPQIKRVLMTGYNIDEYISMIREHNIGNILAKGPGFNLVEVGLYIDSLISGDFFGLDKYFHRESLQNDFIRSDNQSRKICSTIVEHSRVDKPLFLEIALNELISNAVFHGIFQAPTASREQWNENYLLSEHDAIAVSWATDNQKIGVSISDPRGRLRKTDVLRWLDNPIQPTDTNNEHGRGFLLVRRLIDRFIINIARNEKTECIILHYFDEKNASHHKPLMIHEI